MYPYITSFYTSFEGASEELRGHGIIGTKSRQDKRMAQLRPNNITYQAIFTYVFDLIVSHQDMMLISH